MEGTMMLEVARAIERHHEKFNMSEWISKSLRRVKSEEERQMLWGMTRHELLTYAVDKVGKDEHGCGTEMCWGGFGEALFGDAQTRELFTRHQAEVITVERFKMPNSRLLYRADWPEGFNGAMSCYDDGAEGNARIATAVTQFYIGTQGFAHRYNKKLVPGLKDFVPPRPSLKQICLRATVNPRALYEHEPELCPFPF